MAQLRESVDLHVHFTPAQYILAHTSICHSRTNAFAWAQVVPQNRVAFDIVAERRQATKAKHRTGAAVAAAAPAVV